MATQNAIKLNASGLASYDGAGTFAGRTITAGTGIGVSNGDGVAGNPTISAAATVPLSFNTDGSAATPSANAITIAGGTGITTSGAGATVTVTLDTPVVVANGGTGATTLTDHGILLGSGTGAVTALAEATNGQIPIGATGADPTLATITAGSNITVTNGSGSITIAADPSSLSITSKSNADTPYDVVSTDQYISCDMSAGVLSVRLPNAPSTGRVITVKDSSGDAATSNLTVTTVGGAVNIDGATTFVMNTDYEAANFIFNGSSYEVY